MFIFFFYLAVFSTSLLGGVDIRDFNFGSSDSKDAADVQIKGREGEASVKNEKICIGAFTDCRWVGTAILPPYLPLCT